MSLYHCSPNDGGCLSGPTFHLLHGKHNQHLITLSWHTWKLSIEFAAFMIFWRVYLRITLKPWKFVFDVCNWWRIYLKTVKFYNQTAGYGFDRIGYKDHLERELAKFK